MEYGRLGVPEPGGGGSSSRNLTADPTRAPRKSKLKLLLLVAATLMVASAVSAALVVGIRSRGYSSAGVRLHSRRSSQAMSRACSQTRYPSLCVNSLLDFPGAAAASDKDLVHISVNMTLQKFGRALYVAAEIGNLNMDPHVRFVATELHRFKYYSFKCPSNFLKLRLRHWLRSAYEDCLELLDDSVNLLSRSLTSVTGGGGAAASTQDVLTWLSASLTNQDTCTEGFNELNGYVKNQMSDRLKDLSELVSNCLAIYAAAGGDGDFAGIPIQNRRRRLLSNDKEHKHFPVWLSRRDRMLLDIPPTAITADIIVSKDGNGTCKTIAEAIKKVPDYGNRRFIIYVRAGK